ncbi:MAG: phage portal protein, partial [Actinobacteria bacterium]|nr:phage portal protein [Actinomycetota bacterium]
MIGKLFERRVLSFQTLFGAGIDSYDNTRAGVAINQDTVFRIGAIYAAIRLISDTVSTLPVDTFYRSDGERLPFRPRPGWVDNPEPDLNVTRSDHLQMVMVSLLVDGNAFVRILRDPSGDVVGLPVMDPHRVDVVRGENGRVEYRMDQ